MSKESILNNIDSLKCIPVVGHLIQKEDGSYYMGGHDFEIDENCNFKSLTVPYGFVVENTYDFEVVKEYDTEVEYLTTNIVLWTGVYPELMSAVYSDDFYFNQSMEIDLEDGQYRPYEEDSNYTELLEWTYKKLCLLGKADDKSSIEHTEPCFIEAKVIPFSYTEQFNKCFSELKSSYKAEILNNKEVGLKKTKINEILKKFSVKVDDLNFEITDVMTEEELTNKLTEFTESKNDETKRFSYTYRQKASVLDNEISKKSTDEYDSDGNFIKETYCYLLDFDDKYVYFIASVYTKDSYERSTYRCIYSFDEKSVSVKLDDVCEKVIQGYVTPDEQNQLDEMRKSYSLMKEDYEELKSFKLEKETKELKEKKELLYSNFEEILCDNEEYKKLKENDSDLSLEDVENTCYCLVGKLNLNFSKKDDEDKKPVTLSFGIEDDDMKDIPYGGLFEKYGN